MLSKRSGQQEPITYYEGTILYRRDRYRACIGPRSEPEGVQPPGSFEEARQFVIDDNIHRRHLDASARMATGAWRT